MELTLARRDVRSESSSATRMVWSLDRLCDDYPVVPWCGWQILEGLKYFWFSRWSIDGDELLLVDVGDEAGGCSGQGGGLEFWCRTTCTTVRRTPSNARGVYSILRTYIPIVHVYRHPQPKQPQVPDHHTGPSVTRTPSHHSLWPPLPPYAKTAAR